MKSRPIEIFCGTGGVGKTTLASARALQLAAEGKNVLLITIDPAKRLKEILGMSSAQAGQVARISGQIFGAEWEKASFDALLMSPEASLKRIQEAAGSKADLNNPILKALTRPYAGMNEIMGLLEVNHHHKSKTYDCIVLDTPPGKHFLDFLQAAGKIQRFFDKSFMEIFKFLGRKIRGKEGKSNIITSIVSTGVKKLLGYLEKVTGPAFVDQFVDAVAALFQVQDYFLEALRFQEELKAPEGCNWVLVTSAQQGKSGEAGELLREAREMIRGGQHLAINKSLGPLLREWTPPPGSPLETLRHGLMAREERVRDFPGGGFSPILEFPEVFGSSPREHVVELARTWAKD